MLVAISRFLTLLGSRFNLSPNTGDCSLVSVTPLIGQSLSHDTAAIVKVTCYQRFVTFLQRRVTPEFGSLQVVENATSLKDKKEPEYVTMRKETVDLSIRSWLCSTKVGSPSAVNLRFVCEPLRDRVINLILGGI